MALKKWIKCEGGGYYKPCNAVAKYIKDERLPVCGDHATGIDVTFRDITEKDVEERGRW